MSTTTALEDSVQAQLKELFLKKLPTRTFDLVSLVDELLAIAHEAGGLVGSLSPEGYLRFCIPGHSSFDIPLERSLGRLRTICARLGVLAMESSGRDVNLYGDEGTIRRELTCKTDGQPNATHVASFRLQFHNTMGRQDFTLTAQ